VVWRSRDTLEVVASSRYEPSFFGTPTSTSNYVQCSVVCSTTTRETIVVAVTLGGIVHFFHWSDAGEEPTRTVTAYTAMMNANENSCIDTCTVSGSSFWGVALCSNPGGVVLRTFTFAATPVLNWTLTIFSPGTQYTMVTLDSAADTNVLWAVSSTDPGAVVRSVRMGTVNWGTGAAAATSALTTLSASTVPGIPFCTHMGNLGSGSTVHFVALTTLNAGLPQANVYGWTGVNGAALQVMNSPFSRGVVAGRVFLNASNSDHWADSTFRRLLLPMMQSGYSALDTDLAYDPGRPVFLMNLGASPGIGEGSGYTYEIDGVSEHGLLALSGEVGQATHPLVSAVYPGTTGWTMGAPSKLVRITSNSGDADTEVTGTYVLTFDVAAPGKSRRFNGDQWREALQGVPRQGRLALFKPMYAYQCELEPVRRNEVLIPGLTTAVTDGVMCHSAGFLEAPVISALTNVVSTVHPPGAGTYTITAVFEWTDAEGRRYQSAPAVPRSITLAANEQCNIEFARTVACYSGVSVAIYRTPASGSEFKRDGSIDIVSSSSFYTIIQLTDDQLLAQETLYTSLGEVPNDPPPGAQRFARTRDRVWAYGLDRREVIQASKLLQDARGIVWSNSANFFVVLPEDVVAVETLDETAVVFTERAVYTIGGAGPDDTGIGTFTEPGRIPGYVGCVSPRSVISADQGIYFQSQRGIELLPRGFGAAQWVGQPVMDVVESYPECRGVTADPDNDRIIWSMVNPSTWAEILIVLDLRTQSWTQWEVPQTGSYSGSVTARIPTVGLSVGGENPVRTASKPKRPILWADSSTTVRIQHTTSAVDDYYTSVGVPLDLAVGSEWESGWIRLAGTSGWQIIRRMSIVATPLTDDWVLELELRYNDDQSLVASAEWDWSEINYTLGDALTFDVSLPVIQFESIQYRLILTGNNSSGPAMAINAVMLHPESEGPRLGRAYRR
jgi:hypothetical protein